MTLTFDTHSTSLTYLAEATLRPKAALSSKKINNFSTIQDLMDPIIRLEGPEALNRSPGYTDQKSNI